MSGRVGPWPPAADEVMPSKKTVGTAIRTDETPIPTAPVLSPCMTGLKVAYPRARQELTGLRVASPRRPTDMGMKDPRAPKSSSEPALSGIASPPPASRYMAGVGASLRSPSFAACRGRLVPSICMSRDDASSTKASAISRLMGALVPLRIYKTPDTLVAIEIKTAPRPRTSAALRSTAPPLSPSCMGAPLVCEPCKGRC